ncbi:hypothetical protein LK540_17340 [Massilia sp. IC2-278]|uniref:hypothetical protein n=1 Tax=Massilia sp. IC2-278 TaxID=2887200 RepID=UPI001E3AB07C|nr:hypothetical protein [Massilia sp. IC2-278]MCC2962194.1 hypothetical protein [Massilia sp. IC2-278]
MNAVGMGGAIFADAGQAVHVAFVVMGQEAAHGAPFRAALLRVMEQVHLETDQQRHWLDQLRGERAGTVNFAGMSTLDVRAQCALIAQAVRTKLPETEMWVLQAKYGQTDFEDVDGERRFAFSAERIAAIHGLSKWMAPTLPRIKPLALDCMLGRMFANHKKIDISARDLAAQFGGCHKKYIRASWKMRNHLRILEEKAIARLEPHFVQHGLIMPTDTTKYC